MVAIIFLARFMRRFFRSASLLLLTVVVPFHASAATVSELLTVRDEAIVTRGAFIKAAIRVLKVSTDSKQTTNLTYTRPVPKNLQPYVRTAESRGALAHWGKDLRLTSGITRGDALLFLVKIQKLTPSGSKLTTFGDVEKDSAMEDAVRVAIERNWTEPDRLNLFGVKRVLQGDEARLLLRKIIGETGHSIETGPGGEATVQSITIRYKKKEIPQLPENDLLRTVWQLLNEQYLYTDKINDKNAAYKAAEALVNSVGDPYTTFMRPIDAKNFQEQIDGEMSGIGAQVEFKDNILTIVSPLNGSPALKAGLKSGDQIIQVDGKTLSGLTFVEAVQLVRGPQGSVAALRVRRDGTEFDMNVTRDIIRLPEIDISYQNEIAIVRLVQFGQTTERELRELLEKVQTNNPKGLILDLRNNPGGLLHAAEIVVSNFLPKGSGVAVIRSKNEEFTEVTVDNPTIKDDVKLIVLINKGSASASEIVAAALQDAKRATILGEKSFGKGTVQQIVEFRDGSSMKMTIAEWLSPKKRMINGVGVSPDIEVPGSDDRDEQLLRAIDMLR